MSEIVGEVCVGDVGVISSPRRPIKPSGARRTPALVEVVGVDLLQPDKISFRRVDFRNVVGFIDDGLVDDFTPLGCFKSSAPQVGEVVCVLSGDIRPEGATLLGVCVGAYISLNNSFTITTYRISPRDPRYSSIYKEPDLAGGVWRVHGSFQDLGDADITVQANQALAPPPPKSRTPLRVGDEVIVVYGRRSWHTGKIKFVNHDGFVAVKLEGVSGCERFHPAELRSLPPKKEGRDFLVGDLDMGMDLVELRGEEFQPPPSIKYEKEIIL